MVAHSPTIFANEETNHHQSHSVCCKLLRKRKPHAAHQMSHVLFARPKSSEAEQLKHRHRISIVFSVTPGIDHNQYISARCNQNKRGGLFVCLSVFFGKVLNNIR